MHSVEFQLDPQRKMGLYQLLKLEGLVDSGGMAKIVIEQGSVCVNGEIELRKRYQVKVGDIVTYNGVNICCI